MRNQTTIAEIVHEVAGYGARIEVVPEGDGPTTKTKLAVKDAKIPQELRKRIGEHRTEVIKWLTWNPSKASDMMRDALDYVVKLTSRKAKELGIPDRGIPNSEFAARYDAIERACKDEDMFALFVARRAFVYSWLVAVAQAEKAA